LFFISTVLLFYRQNIETTYTAAQLWANYFITM